MVKETQQITPEQEKAVVKKVLNIFSQIPELDTAIKKHWKEIEELAEKIQLEE